MLRVRPLIVSFQFEAACVQLQQLGLSCSENDGDWAEFDSGNGKIGVFRDAPGRHAVLLAFELRDPAMFVRRTLADGTHAELAETRNGPGARVTTPGGTFELSRSTDLRLPEPDSALSVTALWHTPDPAAANTTLTNIGAKFIHDQPDGGALFRAKNGGFVATAKGAGSAVGLGIRHDGGTLTEVGGALRGGARPEDGVILRYERAHP